MLIELPPYAYDIFKRFMFLCVSLYMQFSALQQF